MLRTTFEGFLTEVLVDNIFTYVKKKCYQVCTKISIDTCISIKTKVRQGCANLFKVCTALFCNKCTK